LGGGSDSKAFGNYFVVSQKQKMLAYITVLAGCVNPYGTRNKTETKATVCQCGKKNTTLTKYCFNDKCSCIASSKQCSKNCNCNDKCSNDKTRSTSPSQRLTFGTGHSKKIARIDAANVLKLHNVEQKSKRWTQEEEIVLRVVFTNAQHGTLYTSYSQTSKSLQKNGINVRKHDHARVSAKLQHLQLSTNKS
jgi:hypothetical protein